MSEMKKIGIRNGYVQCPEEWVVLETLGLAEECEHVGVVYIKSKKLEDVPCFIFFSEVPIRELPNDKVRAVLEACVEMYPTLDSLLEVGMLVYPPQIRIYELLAKGEGEAVGYDSKEYLTYPFDAMVVRCSR